jgi:hypothetical protein
MANPTRPDKKSSGSLNISEEMKWVTTRGPPRPAPRNERTGKKTRAKKLGQKNSGKKTRAKKSEGKKIVTGRSNRQLSGDPSFCPEMFLPVCR